MVTSKPAHKPQWCDWDNLVEPRRERPSPGTNAITDTLKVALQLIISPDISLTLKQLHTVKRGDLLHL